MAIIPHNTTKQTGSVWKHGAAKHITFIVTKDCQLACKYCYLVGKNSKERMPWEVAKQAIDYILAHEEDFSQESVVWDFIGGEPFLEIDLIDRICDYLKTEMYRRNHHWFDSYRFSFSTNGINYHTEKVQEFIKKNHNHLSIGITIDGQAGGRLENPVGEILAVQGIGRQAEARTDLLASEGDHVTERVIKALRSVGKFYFLENSLGEGPDLTFGDHAAFGFQYPQI